jgi:hypothetical protein
VALVPYPGADLVAVAAALLDGLDLVVLSGRVLHGSDRARLAARARQRGAVLLPLGPWPGADVELACEQGQWWGVGAGEGDIGRLRTRRVSVRLRGRGVAPAGRSARLLLPGAAGLPAVGLGRAHRGEVVHMAGRVHDLPGVCTAGCGGGG